MLFGLTPLDFLPPWLAGPAMVGIGVFLAVEAKLYSWRQAEAVLIMLVGIGIFIFGVKEMRAKRAEVKASVAAGTVEGQRR